MYLKQEVACFAGGCFWCTQKVFDHIDGVIETKVGYTGGHIKHPSYEKVCQGTTGHVEAVQVVFDSDKVSYERLLIAYWKSIEPTNAKGQFCDVGSQYMPIIFYNSQQQRKKAYESKLELEKEFGEVSVKILEAKEFFSAEDQHQKYYLKNKMQYIRYEKGSGRKS